MESNKLKVGIFVPCCIDQFYPQTGMKMIALLQRLGCNCTYPVEQTCCGQDLYLNGDREGARLLAEKMINMFQPYDYVVGCSSGCVAYMKRFFGEMFYNSSYHNEFGKFTNKVMDITDFLANILQYTPSDRIFPHKVAVLDHCRTIHDYGLFDEPRTLLKAINGLELVELHDHSCCGFGDTFANYFEPISTEMVKQKVAAAQTAGAEYIVSTEPTCLMHLQSYLNKEGIDIKCCHIIDLLED